MEYGTIQTNAKTKIIAVARARRNCPIFSTDWEGIITNFYTRYGMNPHDSKLQGQSYHEAFEEKLLGGRLQPETLAHVVSIAKEEEEQVNRKPEVSRHMGIHLDSTLTIQTRKRFIFSMPSCIGELRSKYRIMTNIWLLAQMRQPGRALYEILSQDTGNDLLDELLTEGNFLHRLWWGPIGIIALTTNAAPQRGLPPFTRRRTWDPSCLIPGQRARTKVLA